MTNYVQIFGYSTKLLLIKLQIKKYLNSELNCITASVSYVLVTLNEYVLSF